MSNRGRRILKPQEIMSTLNDILEDESDGEPLEYSDDDYELENSFNSSSDESDDTIQREILQEATSLTSIVVTETQDQVASQRRGRGRGIQGRRGRPSAGSMLPNPRFETKPGSTLVSPDGTAWTVIETGSTPGRYRCQNVFRDRVGPTSHAKRNVDETCKSAWQLIVSKKIMQHILECTYYGRGATRITR